MYFSRVQKVILRNIVLILGFTLVFPLLSTTAHASQNTSEQATVRLGKWSLWHSSGSYDGIYIRNYDFMHSWKISRILYVDHLLCEHSNRTSTTISKPVLNKARALIHTYMESDDSQLVTQVWHSFIYAYSKQYHVSPHYLYRDVYKYDKRAYIRQTQYDMQHSIDTKELREHPSAAMKKALYKSIALTKRIGNKNIKRIRQQNPWSMNGELQIRKAVGHGAIVVRPQTSNGLLARDVHCRDRFYTIS